MKEKNKNLIYGIGLTAILIVIILVIIIAKSCSKSDGGNGAEVTTIPTIKVVQESGNQEETIKAKLTFRDVKFGTSIKKIKDLEKKQDDTSDKPSQADSKDGYTYLNYSFNTEKSPMFWGSEVGAADTGAMISYVFFQKKLIEVRLQYGKIGQDKYQSIVSSISSKFGNATYSRSYSNGSQDTWWKTSKHTMEALVQDDQIMVYYRKNK